MALAGSQPRVISKFQYLGGLFLSSNCFVLFIWGSWSNSHPNALSEHCSSDVGRVVDGVVGGVAGRVVGGVKLGWGCQGEVRWASCGSVWGGSLVGGKGDVGG